MSDLGINKFIFCYIFLAVIAVLGVCLAQLGDEELQFAGLCLVFGSFIGVPATAFLTRLGQD